MIKRIKNICRRWWGPCWYFSPMIAIGDFLCTTILRNSNGKLKYKIIQSYYERAKEIIAKKYKNIILKWENVSLNNQKINLNDNIFIFWWQGIDDAPPIIKKCICSIKKNAGKHKVILLDKSNYYQYANIPKYIIDKVNNGKINFTLFSDILRCCLLYENGGIWIDPTCYMTKQFDEEMYKNSFYTIKHGDDWEFPICKGYWATFFLASTKKNPLMGFMRNLFFEFWKNEKYFIVYLSIDLFLSIAYDEFDWARNMIQNIPYNNKHRDDLRNMLLKNGGKNFEELCHQVNADTYINKLTYKMFIEDVTYEENALYD